MILETLRNYQINYLNMMSSPYKRYIHIVVNFNEKLIGIIGARGVGKTTFLLQYLKQRTL